MNVRVNTLLAALALIATAGAAHADPVTVGFTRITNNAGAVNPASQFSVVISDAGNGMVDFKFFNNVGIASSITAVYFADGTLLDIAQITSSSGVSFSQGASPGHLPSGENAGFVTTQGFTADSDPPVSHNGVNSASEWLNIRFTLQGSQTFEDTIASLQSGALKIGLHVQAIGPTGKSDSFVNDELPPTVVIPLPSAAGLADSFQQAHTGAGLRVGPCSFCPFSPWGGCRYPRSTARAFWR
jgi:hypothetical protein